MRIPYYFVIPIAILVVIACWKINTRDSDFLTPPSDTELAKISSDAISSLPSATVSEPKAAPVIVRPTISNNSPPPIPEAISVDLGDIDSAPRLDEYSNRAPDGAPDLLSLAKALERAGLFQRALLAYERVLDLSPATAQELQTATLGIQSVRPTLASWASIDHNLPLKALPVSIQIGTGAAFADLLPKILDEVSTTLSRASSGILEFTYKLNIGESLQSETAATPVAIWLTGGTEPASSTDVLSFTTNQPEAIRDLLLKSAFNLVRAELSKSTLYSPVAEAFDDPETALRSHITRLLWREFGQILNPPEAAE